MSSKTLADVALDRALRGVGPREPNCCQQWVRLCIMASNGGKRPAWCLDTALHSAEAVSAHHPPGVQVIRSSRVSDTRIGDVLYCTKGHGEFGHVGIRVDGNRVAENSVRHTGRTHGAIGFCSLEEFGFDLIVRLPGSSPS